MIYKKFQTIAIAAVIASLLLIGINSSEAASITSLSTYVGDDWGDGASVAAHLSTDEDIHFIDWHVDGEYEFTSQHNRGTTWVNVDLGTFTGSLKGEKHSVMAVVQFWEFSDATGTSDFTVYRPVENSSWKHGVYGQSVLYSQTYDGSYLSMSCSIQGYNPTTQTRKTYGKFRLTVYKNGDQEGQPVEELQPEVQLEQGQTYYKTGGPSKRIGPIRDGDTWKSISYVRIYVGTPTWLVSESVDFNENDNLE